MLYYPVHRNDASFVPIGLNMLIFNLFSHLDKIRISQDAASKISADFARYRDFYLQVLLACQTYMSQKAPLNPHPPNWMVQTVFLISMTSLLPVTPTQCLRVTVDISSSFYF